MRGIAVVLLGACGAPGDDARATCSDPPRGPEYNRFVDVTADSGIEFLYSSPDFQGGALASADLDGDGRYDIVAGSRAGGLSLFRNRGGFRFERVVDSGLDATLSICAIAIADLDNDGDRDLVLAGNGTAYVMANEGGRFHEVTRLVDSGATEHVLPVDLNGDGLLDLYVSNRELRDEHASFNRLYMNRAGLQFAEVPTLGAGLSWAATALDIDDDGDQDLYVANDTLVADYGTPPVVGSPLPVDLLLRNDGVDASGVPQFVDLAPELGLAEPRSSMGGTLADLDGDGRLDLYVPNLGAKKLFLRTDQAFVESATPFGVAAIQRINTRCAPNTRSEDCLFLSWTAVVSDFDLDSHDELLVTNGKTGTAGMPPLLLFLRNGSAYEEASPDLACMDARAMIAADLDGDGDDDLLIAQKEGRLAVYDNSGNPPISSWLRVELLGRISNRDGIGAVVVAHLLDGRVLVRAVGAGGAIHASAPTTVTFAAKQIERLEVRWPSGRLTEVDHPPAGPLLVIEPG